MPTSIEQKVAALRAAGLNLGDQVGGEATLYDGGSRQMFAYGQIYFNPRIGLPFEVHGLILDHYLQLGAELSELGYPISDEQDDPSVPLDKLSRFEFGVIRWSADFGLSVEMDSPGGWVTRVVVKFFDHIPPALLRSSRVSSPWCRRCGSS